MREGIGKLNLKRGQKVLVWCPFACVKTVGKVGDKGIRLLGYVSDVIGEFVSHDSADSIIICVDAGDNQVKAAKSAIIGAVKDREVAIKKAHEDFRNRMDELIKEHRGND